MSYHMKERSSALDAMQQVCHGTLGEGYYVLPVIGLMAQGHRRLNLVIAVSIVHHGDILLLMAYHPVARPIAIQDGSEGLLVCITHCGGQTKDRVARGVYLPKMKTWEWSAVTMVNVSSREVMVRAYTIAWSISTISCRACLAFPSKLYQEFSSITVSVLTPLCVFYI